MDATDLHDVEVALEAAFSTLFAARIASPCGRNELLELQLNADQCEKVSLVVIERYFDSIFVFADCLGCRLPTTLLMASALLVSLCGSIEKKRFRNL